MPESTLTLCQSRLYLPVRDFGFGVDDEFFCWWRFKILKASWQLLCWVWYCIVCQKQYFTDAFSSLVFDFMFKNIMIFSLMTGWRDWFPSLWNGPAPWWRQTWTSLLSQSSGINLTLIRSELAQKLLEIWTSLLSQSSGINLTLIRSDLPSSGWKSGHFFPDRAQGSTLL